ncbi:heme exporter protein CcmD [Lamprobacter modestohalophilus]|uniref:Heme exporter protein D n=1 Tax=Lamprobacter modestohalophilus TaxID=1064514 RepID=A0A9X0WBD9_9GAMM|nr:heme exporter protein CcmD [Lamprobacter modestohalophilus]MCF7978696.1 heme exporter protein CcmD [Chromatiaceae bacterium]MBK1619818.1 heme exporter protein CcmD [Lamprobacter modestohalophilus]MCF7993986.1 heme exporter protein CcmD [Chromatiaceae bacterium]MCF8004642.1 heme exporter protein CcmD [Chromatiaceae bacterium]MCF8014727.1 heme exporter protein CcmD [Chromatiaceae bacterium]
MMEFFSQGGYAGYVWGAFGMTFGLLLIEVLQLRSSRKTTLTRIGRLLRLRAPRQASTGADPQRGTSGPTS